MGVAEFPCDMVGQGIIVLSPRWSRTPEDKNGLILTTGTCQGDAEKFAEQLREIKLSFWVGL